MRLTSQILCLLGVTACGSDSPSQGVDPPGSGTASTIDVVELETPAGTRSGQPRLARHADGRVLLSWLETTEAVSTLYHSTFDGEEWSPKLPVAGGDDWFVNWADTPSVQPIDHDFWVAHWLQKTPGGPYAYDVALSLSTDGGQTFGEGMVAHRDGTSSEHGFVSVFSDAGRAGVVWLDGRETAGGAHGHADSKVPAGAMTLRAAALRADGTLEDEQLIDERVCDCCPTDVAMTSLGPVAVYRDRTTDEVRDIYASRLVDGAWQAGRPVARDGWNVAGCPVNGPAIAASGTRVAVAWYTAPGDAPRVLLATSKDCGQHFGQPQLVAGDTAIGRVDVAVLKGGEVVVSWIDASGADGAELCIRVLDAQGQLGPRIALADMGAARAAGVPAIEITGRSLVFAWTDVTGETAQVQTARFGL